MATARSTLGMYLPNGTLNDHSGALEAAGLFPSNLTVQARSDVVHTEARVIDGAGGFGTGLVGR